MKKYFVVSDIHSFYTELKKELYKKGFRVNNKEHILILCGDAFDRSSEAVKMYKFLKKLNNQNRLIYIRGNHEDLLFDCVRELKENDGVASSHHYHNRTVDTVVQFMNENLLEEVLEFIDKNTVDYYETKNYIFVHGWIPYIEPKNKNKFDFLPRYNTNWREASKEEWEKARWANGMELSNLNILEPNKIIVCGHWHCSWGNHLLNSNIEEFPKDSKKIKESFKPYVNKGIIAIDACTAWTHKVNVLVINEEDL